METRHKEKYNIEHANTNRNLNSAVLHMQHLLNKNHEQNETKQHIKSLTYTVTDVSSDCY